MMDYFSKIPNIFFYGLNENKEESILKITKDTKTLLIIHNLYLMTDRKERAITSIDFLIEECGYKVSKKIQPQFKTILNSLKELKLIDFEEDIKSYTKPIKINTKNINVEEGFFVLEEDELEIISQTSDDIREVNNLLKVYLYLKARCYKRDTKDGAGRSQSTFVSYANISIHTLIGEANIKKYIDILVSVNLITYKNLGFKYKQPYKESMTECSNLYVLNRISKDFIDEDIKEGLNAQKYYYSEKGYTIVSNSKYKNNDRKINGRKGYLIKKKNNNTLTETEEQELINIMIKEQETKQQQKEV